MTLEDLLTSRDERVFHQQELLTKYHNRCLICLTVQLPGPVKRNELSLTVAGAGVEAVRKAFAIEYEETRDLETGFEGFFIVDMPPMEAKRMACHIEDTHPLGRLLDIDVVVFAGAASGLRRYSAAAKRGWTSPGPDGCPELQEVSPLGREELGLPPRKCLLCENEARVCMRARTHTTEELLAKIEEMVNNYINL